MRLFSTLSLVLCAFTILTGQANPLFVFENPTAGATGEDLTATVQLVAAAGEVDYAKQYHLPVAGGKGVDVTFEEQRSIHPFRGVRIFHGSSGDPRFAHLPHYRDVILVLNEPAGTLYLTYSTPTGEVAVSYHAGKYRYEQRPHRGSPDKHGHVAFAEKALALQDNISPYCQEQDANGRLIMDVLFTFSIEATTRQEDILGFTVAMAETVNVAYANSLIDNTRIRAVNVAVRDNHTGVDSPALGTNPITYATDMAEVAADMIADFQAGKDGANNNFGGWASTGGFSSISYISSSTIFRHEYGHNMGSSHCSGNSIRPYAAGFDNGTERTIMCGNDVPYFSNPDIDLGNGPLGDPATADNARLTREFASAKANRARHIVPYDAGDGGDCGTPALAEEYYLLQNVATGKYLGPTRFGAAGNPLILVDVADEIQYVWEVHHTGDGSAMIQNANTKRTVEADGSNRGTELALAATTADLEQRLNITATANGTYVINFISNDLILRPATANAADEDPLLQDTLTGTDLDEWQFVTPPAGLAPTDDVVSLDLQATDATCVGGSSGSVTLNVTGGSGSYTYEWETGETTATLTDVAPGEYRVTVTGSPSSKQYAAVAQVMTKDPLIINGFTQSTVPGTKGGITVTAVTNANGNLSYAWSDGGTGAVRTGLDAGDYTVTVTDADGCTDERIFRVSRSIDETQLYLIEDTQTGEYIGLSDVANPRRLLRQGNCPSDKFGHTFEYRGEFTGTWIIRNPSNNSVYDVDADGNLYSWFLAGNGLQYFFSEFPDSDKDDLVTFCNGGGCVTVAPETDGLSALSLQDQGAGLQVLRLIPVDDCGGSAGDACNDGNNSTDDDIISLLCNCCGEENDCFDVAGAAPNGDGDLDGDGVCVTDDCDDNDATYYVGALCDDGETSNYGDAYGDDCLCAGRPEVCSETGDDLPVVSFEGTAIASSTLSTGGPASVLTDGIIDGAFSNGNVWHSDASYSFVDIDLNTDQSIRELRVYPRTDPDLARLARLFIFISDSPFTGPSVEDSRDQSVYEYQIPTDYTGNDPVVIQPNVIGRYVRIKQGEVGRINLTEVEVRSCPLDKSLPVTLLDFTGTTLSKTNQLDWRVAEESAFSHYVVERSSADGPSFWKAIGEVTGTNAGSADYHFLDESPLPTALYRLRMEDLDGTFTYSPVVHLQRSADGGFTVAPVPATASFTLRGLVPESGPVTIYSTTGQLVKTLRPGAVTTIRVDVQQWPAGVYLVRDGLGVVRRVLVE
ncbi:hypothetical protein [Lewinella sp. 4G2]|uniref:hypothetical protein n=1 Tax=Lewinella sp. 4G2 TaxID=1803372 RepID=UPI0007B4B98D|nr:hypothetical protein [Lewinella sp. 4G2]OAV43881.1 hypothetical protein A3850_004960 [Lewinella sp. 4G2]